MATLRESTLLTASWGEPLTGDCDNCESQSGMVWEIGGHFYCSSECALQGLPEGESTTFEEYLNDLRLRANLLDIYDAVRLSDR